MRKLILILTLFLTIFNISPIYAQGPIENIPVISECLDQYGDMVQRIICVVRAVFYFLGFIALAWGGFEIFRAAWTFMTSGEKAEEVTKARSKILFAIIGIVVALLSFAISWLIGRLLGFQTQET